MAPHLVGTPMRALLVAVALVALAVPASAQTHEHSAHAHEAMTPAPPPEPAHGRLSVWPALVEIERGATARVLLYAELVTGAAAPLALRADPPLGVTLRPFDAQPTVSAGPPTEIILLLDAALDAPLGESTLALAADGFDGAEARVLVVAPPVAPAPPGDGDGARLGFAVGAGALLVIAAALYSRLRKPDLLAHATRARLLALAQARPGVSLADARRELGVSKSVASHHLEKLRRAGLVHVVREPTHLRVFAAGEPATVEPPMRERVLARVREAGVVSAADLARALGASRQLVHHHVRALAASGEVHVAAQGRALMVRAR